MGREAAAEAAADGEVKGEDCDEEEEERGRDEDDMEVEAASGEAGRGDARPVELGVEGGRGRKDFLVMILNMMIVTGGLIHHYMGRRHGSKNYRQQMREE